MQGRKAIEMGKGTILISLPKDWVRRNGIKKGATVGVEELSARRLMIRPIEGGEDEPKQAVIEYP
ncbi:MAG TPA: AbrB/MazE/SpoVT family DNA-binding domain-containing protein, partial [Nitrososphaerales archaeon]